MTKKPKKIVNKILDLLDSDKPAKPEQPPKEIPKEPKPFEHIPEKKEPETTTEPGKLPPLEENND